MKLQDLHHAVGAVRKTKRRGKGAATGLGGTAGKGHKGQKARSGGRIHRWFEGGQMPLQRRLPKRGFLAVTITKAAEVRSGDLARVVGGAIDLESLKKAGVVPAGAERAKIILAGDVSKAFKVTGIGASKGARAAIEKAGGSVADLVEAAPVAKLPKKSAGKPAEKPQAAAK
jgi:large subunit ribosomal protein L15